jgi:putative transposase
MNEPKVQDLDYINFLLATPRVVTATEAERVQPEGPRRAAHDAFTRLLYRLEPDTAPLWREAEVLVDRTRGLLVIDDTTLDKPYSYEIALVHRHWSGKHRRVVSGINLVSLVWSDDTHAIPCDYRLFDAPNDGLTKNDHFRAMLETARKRDSSAGCVIGIARPRGRLYTKASWPAKACEQGMSGLVIHATCG